MAKEEAVRQAKITEGEWNLIHQLLEEYDIQISEDIQDTLKDLMGKTILKQEIYYGKVYYSYEDLKLEIERYIKYYNEYRIKEKLGWMSPVEYRLNLMVA